MFLDPNIYGPILSQLLIDYLDIGFASLIVRFIEPTAALASCCATEAPPYSSFITVKAAGSTEQAFCQMKFANQ